MTLAVSSASLRLLHPTRMTSGRLCSSTLSHGCKTPHGPANGRQFAPGALHGQFVGVVKIEPRSELPPLVRASRDREDQLPVAACAHHARLHLRGGGHCQVFPGRDGIKRGGGLHLGTVFSM